MCYYVLFEPFYNSIFKKLQYTFVRSFICVALHLALVDLPDYL